MFHPTHAERARTVLHAAAEVTVLTMPDREDVASVHGIDEAGRPLLLAPAGSALAVAAAEDEISAVIHAIDVCPTPLADRVRAEAWIGGWLSAVPAAEQSAAALAIAGRQPAEHLLDVGTRWRLLRLEPAEVRLRDTLHGHGDTVHGDSEHIGTVHVDPELFAAAAPDPLIEGEAGWLGHLITGHPREFAQLCLLIPAGLRPDGAEIRAIGLDRHGLIMRIDHQRHRRQVRLSFARPVTGAAGLPHAMGDLLHTAAAHMCRCTTAERNR